MIIVAAVYDRRKAALMFVIPNPPQTDEEPHNLRMVTQLTQCDLRFACEVLHRLRGSGGQVGAQ